MKVFKNNIALHKLYGFLLLNTSLIVFVPIFLIFLNGNEITEMPIEIVITAGLALSGLVLSILFILKKKIAIHLLSFLLVLAIIVLVIFMIRVFINIGKPDFVRILLVLNTFGFFIVEGVLGLLIIHSKKLLNEFESYE